MPPSAPPSPPPPLQPGERLQARLQVTATVAGSVADFDAAAQARFVTGLAAELGVDAAQVTVTSIAPASILVTAAVSYDSVSLAQAGAVQWEAISTAELSAAIGTAVEAMGGTSVTEVILGAPSAPPLPPLEPGSGGGGEGVVEGGSGEVGSGASGRRRVASLTSDAAGGGELGSGDVGGEVSAADHPAAVSRTTNAAAGDATLCYPDPRYRQPHSTPTPTAALKGPRFALRGDLRPCRAGRPVCRAPAARGSAAPARLHPRLCQPHGERRGERLRVAQVSVPLALTLALASTPTQSPTQPIPARGAVRSIWATLSHWCLASSEGPTAALRSRSPPTRRSRSSPRRSRHSRRAT
eukprot:scaffold132839_cov60-Phaeocystis_antarctica.AAC.2